MVIASQYGDVIGQIISALSIICGIILGQILGFFVIGLILGCRKLKILRIIRDKRVDLERLRRLTKQLDGNVESILETYNVYYKHYPLESVRDETRLLTLKEAEILIDWLEDQIMEV